MVPPDTELSQALKAAVKTYGLPPQTIQVEPDEAEFLLQTLRQLKDQQRGDETIRRTLSNTPGLKNIDLPMTQVKESQLDKQAQAYQLHCSPAADAEQMVAPKPRPKHKAWDKFRKWFV